LEKLDKTSQKLDKSLTELDKNLTPSGGRQGGKAGIRDLINFLCDICRQPRLTAFHDVLQDLTQRQLAIVHLKIRFQRFSA
jgi:hypothetical protein